MKKLILFTFGTFITCLTGFTQITITQADIGTAGDSIMVAYDEPTGVNVGGTGAQTWTFNFSVTNINSLNFVNVANTTSGANFPSANLAIERQDDTIFFKSDPVALEIDGLAGDWLGQGYNIAADFEPNAKQIDFPSTFGDSFLDTAIIDTIVGCAVFGLPCDSAHVRREAYYSSNIDAHGSLQTPSGTYATIRQHLREQTWDRVWAKLPFVGWQSTPTIEQEDTTHFYRWHANGELWPVLSAVADGPAGDILNCEFKIGENVIGQTLYSNDVSCADDCNGSAEVKGLGGLPPYDYAWPASAGGQTTAAVSGLCAGSYVVTISDANSSEYEITIEISSPTVVQIAGSFQNASEAGNDGAIDITPSGGTGAYTYAWIGPDGFSAITQDITGLDSGTYEVTVTDANGCSESAAYTIGSAVGVDELSSNSIQIFPNPANNQLTVLSTGLIRQMRIVDLLGNTIADRQLNQTKANVDLTEFSSGIYMIEINTDSGMQVQKLTIRH